MTTAPIELDLPADEPVINFQRFFKAPPDLVYSVFTDADHLRHWWGPRSLEIVKCDVDLRVGGEWHVVHRAPDGEEIAFRGEFRELDRPRRIVRTFVWEGAPDAWAVETCDLAAVEDGTLATMSSRYPRVEDRDMHIANGMEGGMNESFERFDELLAALQT